MTRTLLKPLAITCAGLISLVASADPGPRQDDPSRPHVVVVETTRSQPNASVGIARNDAEVHGRLAHAKIDLVCHGSNPRVTRRAFARALGLNLVDHFPSDPSAAGIPGELHLDLRSVTAVDALRMLVDLSGGTQPGAWQVREGILEMGLRETLARRTTHVTRVYDLTTLIIEAPYFDAPELSNPMGGNGPQTIRANQREVAVKIMEAIIQSVEPDAWLPLSSAELSDGIRSPIDPRDPYRGRQLDPKLRSKGGALAPLKCEGRWAAMFLKDKQLVVRAPAFVHIGIDGLPEAVPPPAGLVGSSG